MIKVNVIINKKSWKKNIKNPKLYFKKRLKKLNFKSKFIKKNKFIFSIMLSGNKEIKILNKKFRKKSKTTDILSFPYQDKLVLNGLIRKKKEIYLGDIIINISKIKKNNFTSEFDKLWIHGLLHLFGYKHKSDKDYYKMLKVENSFYSTLN